MCTLTLYSLQKAFLWRFLEILFRKIWSGTVVFCYGVSIVDFLYYIQLIHFRTFKYIYRILSFMYVSFRHNIDTVLTQLIGELKNKFLFTWVSLIYFHLNFLASKKFENSLVVVCFSPLQDQNQCTKTGFMCFGSKYKPLFLKELKKIWNKKYSTGEYSSSNTLLITDPDKAILNPVLLYNLITLYLRYVFICIFTSNICWMLFCCSPTLPFSRRSMTLRMRTMIF